ncbi:MAG: hypothetical protein ACFFDF_24730 [Candidatus Odinarchaeota archaeon]
MNKKIICVEMWCDCQLCGKPTNIDNLKWCLMTNKELNLRMLVHYGTTKNVCDNCREKYDLPLFNFDKKVSINVMRSTRAVLRDLGKKLGSYDSVFKHLIEKAGYEKIYEKVDKNKQILKLRKEW